MFLSTENPAGTANPPQQYSEASLIPVLSAKELLESSERQTLIKKMKGLAGVPKEIFHELYLPLINRFSEFVQVLPKTWGGRLLSLLDEGLKRAQLVLQIHQEQGDSEQDAQFQYAMFSLALLSDIGKVYYEKKVMISGADGTFVTDWLPLQGLLVDQAQQYKIRQYDGHTEQYCLYVTPLLARQLMPEEGFLWLASNPKLMKMWLAGLIGDERTGGGLTHYAGLAKLRLDHLLEQAAILESFDIEITEGENTQLAEDFLAWLKEGLADDSISVNQDDSNVHIVENGVFIDAQLFKDYCSRYSRFNNYIILAQQFNNLGLTKRSGQDFKFEQYFSETPDAKRGRMAAGGMFKQTTAEQTKPTAKKGVAGAFLGKQVAKEISSKPKLVTTKQGMTVGDPGVIFAKVKAPPLNANLRAAATVHGAARAFNALNQIKAKVHPLNPPRVDFTSK